MVQEIASAADFDKVLADAGDKLVVVDYFATWCGPCRRISPYVEELSGEFTGVVFVKVDVDKVQDLAGKHGVRAMPTFKFFKNGSEIPDSEMVGASPPTLKSKVETYK